MATMAIGEISKFLEAAGGRQGAMAIGERSKFLEAAGGRQGAMGGIVDVGNSPLPSNAFHGIKISIRPRPSYSLSSKSPDKNIESSRSRPPLITISSVRDTTNFLFDQDPYSRGLDIPSLFKLFRRT